MKVSLNTVKQFIDFELPPTSELKKRINEQLGGIEEIVDLSTKYAGIVIVTVASAVKHPDADKLTVCTVDDGGAVKDVPRDENGYVQVVCGAPNVHEGMFAVWLPPGVTVPASVNDAEPFVLSARELRGVVSQGMLAAADELAIGSGHNGIVELTNEDLLIHHSSFIIQNSEQPAELKPGLDFARTFYLDDTIIDIENKMFTHRPDCFGQLGVAREIAGILGHKFTSPEWYSVATEFVGASGLELTVTNKAAEKVPRFMAVAIKDVTVKPSPFWLQCELVRLGSKPINNIVDITNYTMLITAQPLHAYDYDKLAGATLGVRMGRAGEKLPLLNGKTYDVTPDDIVIVDGEKPIGMGGVMGGGNSEVSADTKNIVLECATFDMYTIRKTSMRHGLFTDAVARFNKGQSPLQNGAVIARAIDYVRQLANGVQASDVFDYKIFSDWRDDYFGGRYEAANIDVNEEYINDRLGSQLSEDDVCRLLTNVEIDAHGLNGGGDYICIEVPFWRTDLDLPEDIVEEVGRLHGFDKLPRELPQRSIKPAPKNQKRVVASLVRNSLRTAGANEVLTYSFVHKNILERAGQDTAHAFKLGNALSPDLQYYRLSVLPSLLDKVHGNIKAGHDEFALFEIGKGHNVHDISADDGGLPAEIEYVDLIYASKQPQAGAAYYKVRRLATQLASDLGFTIKLVPVKAGLNNALTAAFDLQRSAIVTSRKGELIGVIGELKQSVVKQFKLPEYSAAFTFGLPGLIKAHANAGVQYAPLSRFPSLTQDITLQVSANTAYEDIFWITYNAITAADSSAQLRLSPLAIYQGDNKQLKNVTLRAEVTSHTKTLTDADVSPLIDAAASAAHEQLGAKRL